jgi:hypothetical protein
MVPQNGLEMIALALAVIGGTLCVIATSNTGQQSSSFWKKTRYQGYSWLLMSGFSMLLLNWKGLELFKSLDQAHFTWLYAAWAFAAVVLAHLAALAAIAVETCLLKHSRALRPACLSLMVRFVKDGWDPYQTEKQALIAAEAMAGKTEQEQAALVVAGLAIDVLTRLPTADAAAREMLAEKILLGMQGELKKIAGDDKLELHLNYLRAVPWARAIADPVLQSGMRFDFGIVNVQRESRYTYLLILHYRLLQARGPDIRFGVADHSRADTRAALLPGAPEAVAYGRPWFRARGRENRFALEFAAGVPAAVRGEVTKFFDGLDCLSVLSIPLVKGSETVGVLNVESSATDLIGRGRHGYLEAATVVSPLCTILAHVVGD